MTAGIKTPSNILEPKSLLEVVPKQTIQALLQSFLYQERTGMVLILDELQADGTRPYRKVFPEDGADPFANFNPFCRAFRASDTHDKACEGCDLLHLDKVFGGGLPSGKVHRYRCHMQLWDAIYPVTLGGKVRGGIYAGQKIAKSDTNARQANRRRLTSEFRLDQSDAEALTKELGAGAEEEADIERFWESFDNFAETFQVTVNALFDAWQLKQTMSVSVAVNQELAATAPLQLVPAAEQPAEATNLFAPVESLLDVLEHLTGSPLWFLVRRGSRYRAEVASTSGRQHLPFQLKVASLIEFPPDRWHEAASARELREELAKLRPKIAPEAQFYRVDSPNLMGSPLSAVLLAGQEISEAHRLTVESALRAVAYPVHISQLLQRQQHTQKENEKHFAFIGHHLKQPLSTAYALAWRLARCVDTSSATLHRRQVWADELMEKGTQALEDALTLQTAVIGTPTTVDLIPMLEGLARDRQLVAENEGKGVRIHFSREARLYSKVRALPARLRVALAALIDNAAKYSWPQETVLLRLVQLQGFDPAGPIAVGVVLWIENHGDGFTRKQKQQLYQVGGRIPGMSKRHAREGYGLGLTQAKSIVEDYGGTLDIDSELLTNSSGTTRKYRTVVKLILQTDTA